ncbi:MAG: hypothetical protein ACREV6_19565 [Clostridium sp.]|uniref:hypothetical protein n=1 Tax=Clostridium sp. TaxID=1506 RepID=UPI003D6D367A
MKYVLELSFAEKPVCEKCMLSGTKGLDLNGESVIACYGLSRRLKCPEDGCRKDCPLDRSYGNKEFNCKCNEKYCIYNDGSQECHYEGDLLRSNEGDCMKRKYI